MLALSLLLRKVSRISSVSNGRTCILLPKTGVYPALGAMLAEVLCALTGWRTVVAHTAATDFLDSDLLLLAGQCRNIEHLSGLLQRRRGRKPVTVHWQLEPLPPPGLSSAGERIGLRVARCSWGRLPLATRRVLNVVLPFRTRLFRWLQAAVARPYTRTIADTPRQDGWRRFHLDIYGATMSEWLWLRDAHRCGWLDFCFASNPARVQFLQSRGVTSEVLPVGYHQAWGRNRHLPRDIDVVFLGGDGKGPRGALVRELCERLHGRGITLTVAHGIYGGAREDLLNRCKIMLTLLRVPHDLPGMRVLLGLASGALVLSEACEDTGVFTQGRHFVTAEIPRLAQSIEYYLAETAERERIAREGHRFVTEELTLEKTVERILQRALP